MLLYQKDKRAKPEKFEKKFLSESGEQLGKYFHFF